MILRRELYFCPKPDTILDMEIPEEAKTLLAKGDVYFATTDGLWPNITITASGVVISEDELLISDCAMTKAKENILKNPNCCIEAYDPKIEVGYKAFGKATYHSEKEKVDIAKKRLEGEPFEPKGAVIIKIDKIFKVE